MADKTIQFTRSYTVKDEEARTFAEGEIVDLPAASAHHFINRGAAKEVPKGTKPATAKSESK